jgi:hypothetical protein
MKMKGDSRAITKGGYSGRILDNNEGGGQDEFKERVVGGGLSNDNEGESRMIIMGGSWEDYDEGGEQYDNKGRVVGGFRMII